ncbi:MAG: pentapeptide repeat-containing protein [Myxococcales bacterium]|nr:pentapeptide repeat-containing protein [Myxococcales bacterium]
MAEEAPEAEGAGDVKPPRRSPNDVLQSYIKVMTPLGLGLLTILGVDYHNQRMKERDVAVREKQAEADIRFRTEQAAATQQQSILERYLGLRSDDNDRDETLLRFIVGTSDEGSRMQSWAATELDTIREVKRRILTAQAEAEQLDQERAEKQREIDALKATLASKSESDAQEKRMMQAKINALNSALEGTEMRLGEARSRRQEAQATLQSLRGASPADQVWLTRVPLYQADVDRTTRCPIATQALADDRAAGRRPALRGADLRFCALPDTDLTGVHLQRTDLRQADLRGARMSNASLYAAVATRANFASADLSNAYLEGAVLREADLSKAKLGQAYLSAGDLRGADLSGALLVAAQMDGALLRGAKLVGADLRQANLVNADLRGADLTGAIVEDTQLAGIIEDEQTLWPDKVNGRAVRRKR